MIKKITAVLFISIIMLTTLVGCTDSNVENSTNSVAGSDTSSNIESASAVGSYNDKDNANVDALGETSKSVEKTETAEENTDTAEENTNTEEENTDIAENENNKEKTNNKDKANNKVILLEDKLVYRSDITIETTEYDKSYKKIKKLMNKYGCIIQNEDFSNRDDSYTYDEDYRNSDYKLKRQDLITIRVPSKNFDKFISASGSVGNVIRKTQSVDNITESYYDTKMQLEALKSQMKEYKRMMDSADNINDMIQLTESIEQLQYRINRLETSIRTMDLDVNYSYVTLKLNEVVEYTQVEKDKKTNKFIDRLKNTCLESIDSLGSLIEWLIFFIIRALPVAIVFGPITYIVVKLAKKHKIKTLEKERKLQEDFYKQHSELFNRADEDQNSQDKNNKDENKNNKDENKNEKVGNRDA